MLWKACALLFFVASIGSSFGDRNNITAAKIWLEEYNTEAEKVRPEAQEASWTWNTNITDYNNRLKLEAEKKKSEFDKRSYNQTLNWDWKNFTEINAKRQFYKIADIGESVLPTDKFQQITKAKSNMQSVYSKARVCNKPGDQDPSKCYPLNPTLENIMAKSTDWKELAWAWEGWRNETGRKMPDDYEKFVELANEAAGMNGYTDNGDYWRSWYETENFEKQMEELFIGLKDLYKLLHAYARKKLKERFVGHPFPDSGQIPAHLLGNMWAQSWGNLFTLLAPYPGKPLDVTEMMREQNYTTRKMFDLSEKFFTDLGLDPMPPKFYNDSMLDKPEDGRDVVCHASAWDFYNRKDFRIKQCTQVTMDWLITTHHEMGHVQYFLQYKDQPVVFRRGCQSRIKQCTRITMDWLITTHHEMGHVQYYLQYKDQPVVFRRGANPGFHEAIGDVLALSVSTPKHLKKINLLRPNQNPDDEELQLNFLMNQALKKIAFIPFGYLIDQWRWKVFKGETKKDEYNEDWWNLRCKHQGVSPPVQRFNTDFDAGSKFHVPNNTPYIRYFVSYVIQFQFHKALCKEAGHNGPLHKCDIDQSTEAGNKLAAMMKLGSSKEWPDAMEAITGQRKMNVSDLIEYFAPLEDWLKKEVKNETLGWDDQCGRNFTIPTPPPTSPPTTPTPTPQSSTVKPTSGFDSIHNNKTFIGIFIAILAIFVR